MVRKSPGKNFISMKPLLLLQDCPLVCEKASPPLTFDFDVSAGWEDDLCNSWNNVFCLFFCFFKLYYYFILECVYYVALAQAYSKGKVIQLCIYIYPSFFRFFFSFFFFFLTFGCTTGHVRS